MNILLATDGSPFSQAARELLMRLSWPATRQLTVLSVVDKLKWPSQTEASEPEDASQDSQQLQHTMQQDAQHLVAQEAESFKAIGWAPRTLLREGHAAHEIVSVADEIEADVIAVGSRGMGGVKRFLLGSVSQHVLTYAPCSVLIARQQPDSGNQPESEETPLPEGPKPPLRILLAYDGSATSQAAVEMLAALQLQDHTQILLTTVMTLLTYYRMDILQTMSPSWQASKRAAREALEQAAERLRQATPNVNVQLRESDDTSQALLDAAKAFDANLIVIGHKGISEIERLLLGSVATRVVHHAPCSVWVVRE